jgi:hypothetical protein
MSHPLLSFPANRCVQNTARGYAQITLWNKVPLENLLISQLVKLQSFLKFEAHCYVHKISARVPVLMHINPAHGLLTSIPVYTEELYLRVVRRKPTEVSEERIASIFRVE